MSATWVWDEEHEGAFLAQTQAIRDWVRPILLELRDEGQLDSDRDLDAIFDAAQALYFDMLRRARFSPDAADAAFDRLLRGLEATLGLAKGTLGEATASAA